MSEIKRAAQSCALINIIIPSPARHTLSYINYIRHLQAYVIVRRVFATSSHRVPASLIRIQGLSKLFEISCLSLCFLSVSFFHKGKFALPLFDSLFIQIKMKRFLFQGRSHFVFVQNRFSNVETHLHSLS